jgi:hypothetical protein
MDRTSILMVSSEYAEGLGKASCLFDCRKRGRHSRMPNCERFMTISWQVCHKGFAGPQAKREARLRRGEWERAVVSTNKPHRAGRRWMSFHGQYWLRYFRFDHLFGRLSSFADGLLAQPHPVNGELDLDDMGFDEGMRSWAWHQNYQCP